MNKEIFYLFLLNSIHAFQSCKGLNILQDFILHFFSNVTIDVNGKITFSKIGKSLNCGI